MQTHNTGMKGHQETQRPEGPPPALTTHRNKRRAVHQMAHRCRLAFLHILCSRLLDVKQEAIPSGGLVPGSQLTGFQSCHCPGEPWLLPSLKPRECRLHPYIPALSVLASEKRREGRRLRKEGVSKEAGHDGWRRWA